MKKKTRLTTILILAAVTAFALTGCSSSKKTEINLTNYVTVSFSGTDGAGTATVHYSDSQAANAVAEAMGVDLTSSVSTEASIYMAVDDVNKSVTPNSGLSNGDVVTVSISMASDDWITDSMAKKVEFVGGSVDVTVEGLAEAVAEGEEESEEEESLVDEMGWDSELWTEETDSNGNIGYVLNDDAISDEEAKEYLRKLAEAHPDLGWMLDICDQYENIMSFARFEIGMNQNVDQGYTNFSDMFCYYVTDEDIAEYITIVIDEYPDMEWINSIYADDDEILNFICYCITIDFDSADFHDVATELFNE